MRPESNTPKKEAHADLKRRFQDALREKQKQCTQNKVKPSCTEEELIEAIEWVNSLS